MGGSKANPRGVNRHALSSFLGSIKTACSSAPTCSPRAAARRAGQGWAKPTAKRREASLTRPSTAAALSKRERYQKRGLMVATACWTEIFDFEISKGGVLRTPPFRRHNIQDKPPRPRRYAKQTRCVCCPTPPNPSWPVRPSTPFSPKPPPKLAFQAFKEAISFIRSATRCFPGAVRDQPLDLDPTNSFPFSRRYLVWFVVSRQPNSSHSSRAF